ncbi:hypothetical protein ACFL27_12030 [candidate division CSSED10-310 bacterium]|uniref:DUF4249 family protein n=1 Tax=candidate division CSSED10-310 bacterium TaxID=2855610 RepID=A0ABV6YXI2_UNCC1
MIDKTLKSKTASLIVFFVTLIFLSYFSCYDVMNHGLDGKGQISFSIILSKATIETHDITDIRLTVKQNGATVWTQTYDIDVNYAYIELDVGSGYTILAEALDRYGSVQCYGESDPFIVEAGKTTEVGFIELDCLATPTPTATRTPTFTPTPARAEIIIRSDPDPVPYSHYEDGYYYWLLYFYVEEKAGVGATLTEWYADYFDLDNDYLNTQEFSVQNFSDWFTMCDPKNGAYIEPFATLCTDFYFRRTSAKGWYAINHMRFTDDYGNDFWVEGRITLLDP